MTKYDIISSLIVMNNSLLKLSTLHKGLVDCIKLDIITLVCQTNAIPLGVEVPRMHVVPLEEAIKLTLG